MNDHRAEPTGSPPDPTDPQPPQPEALESLDTAAIDAELEADDGQLRGSLRALLEPPSDIEDRVADTVSQQLIGRSAAGTALDLLGLGVRTLMTILTEPPPPADRNGTGAAHDGGPGAAGPTAEGRAAT
ncbi:hypothetical protein [Dermatobacter hominis]|uniref:hypothetical protein n=1 Tax=Dermatobacter hominis TaxID=2884263 RepID=UPI001D10885D|nr:hypothetical protein [Dermatobacter hominis]UDY36349.1 hypothetical protein LH044_02160 [Dermatobacter hominis]